MILSKEVVLIFYINAIIQIVFNSYGKCDIETDVIAKVVTADTGSVATDFESLGCEWSKPHDFLGWIFWMLKKYLDVYSYVFLLRHCGFRILENIHQEFLLSTWESVSNFQGHGAKIVV